MAEQRERDEGMEYLRNCIQSYENFPIPGVLFHDIFGLFRDPKAFEILISRLQDRITRQHARVDVIVGLDARGFLFGPTLAARLHCAFAPIRKKGKLPGKCHSIESSKEYGKDVLEIQEAACKEGDIVIIVDDLLATGGTMAASVSLIRKTGASVAECVAIIGLPELDGVSKVDAPVHCLFDMKAGC
eukprot:m.71989 g.71989  ORF g.71989 m.71989 type:complete len:187 (-) comp7975_c0_seq2:476-1036(-)